MNVRCRARTRQCRERQDAGSDRCPALLVSGWPEDAPVLVVHQAMIIVSPTLGARQWPEKRSKLYNASFTHRFRKGVKTAK